MDGWNTWTADGSDLITHGVWRTVKICCGRAFRRELVYFIYDKQWFYTHSHVQSAFTHLTQGRRIPDIVLRYQKLSELVMNQHLSLISH